MRNEVILMPKSWVFGPYGGIQNTRCRSLGDLGVGKMEMHIWILQGFQLLGESYFPWGESNWKQLHHGDVFLAFTAVVAGESIWVWVSALLVFLSAPSLLFGLLLQRNWTWGPGGQGAVLLVNCDRDEPTSETMDNEDNSVHSYKGTLLGR